MRRPGPPAKVKEAIALAYDPGKDRAPAVIAKGRGRLAERIVETAAAHGVTVISDPIALETLRFLDVGQEVPPRVYHMVAEILAFVYSLADRAEQNAPAPPRRATPGPASRPAHAPQAGTLPRVAPGGPRPARDRQATILG